MFLIQSARVIDFVLIVILCAAVYKHQAPQPHLTFSHHNCRRTHEVPDQFNAYYNQTYVVQKRTKVLIVPTHNLTPVIKTEKNATKDSDYTAEC